MWYEFKNFQQTGPGSSKILRCLNGFVRDRAGTFVWYGSPPDVKLGFFWDEFDPGRGTRTGSLRAPQLDGQKTWLEFHIDLRDPANAVVQVWSALPGQKKTLVLNLGESMTGTSNGRISISQMDYQTWEFHNVNDYTVDDVWMDRISISTQPIWVDP
jgi:hypothetical protein